MQLKTISGTFLLCLGTILAFGQEKINSLHGGETSIGYVRGVNKLHDLQASPMHYYTNYNGAKGEYRRITVKNLWYFGLQAGLGEMIAPDLGKRKFRFEEGGETFYLTTTMYRGEIHAQYYRNIHATALRQKYFGIGLQNSFYYADGLAMNIWAMNMAELSIRYKSIRKIGKKHQIEFTAALPLFSSIARMPYSNVVSKPDRSQSSAFLDGSTLVWLGNFFHADLSLQYQFQVSGRTSLQAAYRYRWLYYAKPKTIQMSDHQVGLSWVYKLQLSK